MSVQAGQAVELKWTLLTGNAGAFSQQVHLFLELGDRLVEYTIDVNGDVAAKPK